MANDLKSTYLSGKREFLEIYGTYIETARIWRNIAFMSIALSIILAVGIIYISKETKIVPYAVEINKTGNIRDMKILQPIDNVNQYYSRYFINEYISDVFTNTGSVYADKMGYIFVFNHSLVNAKSNVLHYLKKRVPWKDHNLRDVSITSVLQHGSSNVYTVNFSVSSMLPRSSTVLKTITYTALLTLVVIPPHNMKEALKNPLGIFVKDFSYTKVS